MYKKTYWHSCSHVLAQAVKRLFPEAKLGIGPAIEAGFYYDFDVEKPFTGEDLDALEVEMGKICKEKLPIERFELPKDEALHLMEEKANRIRWNSLTIYLKASTSHLPTRRVRRPLCGSSPRFYGSH